MEALYQLSYSPRLHDDTSALARSEGGHGCARNRCGRNVARMSIPVEPADIGNQMERFGTAAYVLTVRDDATPHIAHLAMRLDGDVLRCGASRSAAANVADRRISRCSGRRMSRAATR